MEAHQRRFRHGCYGFAVLVLFVCATSAHSQDHILDRLPRAPAVYIWCDDVPELLDTLESMFDLSESDAEALWQPANEQGEDTRPRHSANRNPLEEWAVLKSIWVKLHDEQLFDGQAVLVLYLDPRDTSRPQHRFAFLAQSSGTREEVAQFMAFFESPESEDNKPRPATNVFGQKLLTPAWSFEAGWLTWSNDDETNQLLSDLLVGTEVARHPLAKDRTFLNTFKNIDSRIDARPILKLYATEEVIPLLGTRVAKELEWVSDVQLGNWNALYLNQMRGFGLKFYLDEPSLVRRLQARLAIDAFLSVAQPKHGFIKGLDSQPDREIDYRIPVPPNAILGKFSQFTLDPEAIYEGAVELLERENERLEKEQPAQVVDDPGQAAETLMWKTIQRLGIATYRPPGSIPEDFASQKTILLAQLAGDETEADEAARILEDLASKEPLPTETSEATSDESKQVTSNELDERHLELMKSYGATLQSGSTFELRTRGDYNIVLEKPRARQGTVELLAMLQASPGQPGDWISIDNPSTFDSGRESATPEPNLQLADLESLVDQMRDELGNQTTLCGLLAYWPDGLLQHVSRIEKPTRQMTLILKGGEQDSTMFSFFATGEMNATERRQAAIARTLIEQLLKVAVATASVEDDGFRIQGIIVSPDRE